MLVGMQIVTATMENSMEGASLVAQSVKNPAAMQETGVQSPGPEDPLEKEMATHSNSSWKIPEGPGRLHSMGWQKSRI